MSAVLGIDPGVNGGLAVLSENGVPLHVQAFRPTMTHKELIGHVADASECLIRYASRECFVEKVGFKKGDGGKGANTFGRVDGLLRGAAWALGLEVHDVSPLLWQTRLECLTGGNKNVSKRKAIELFGGRGIKITHAVADALLIAEFGRRTTMRKETPK